MEFKKKSEVKLTERINAARFHPKSETGLLAAATSAGNVHTIESESVKTKLEKHHNGSPIRNVRFTKDGRLVTIAKTVKVHDLVSNETTLTLKRGDGDPEFFCSVFPYGNDTICAGDDDGGLFVWDTRTPQEPVFSAYDCKEFISDIDGCFENRRLVVCTSGEGSLTAYDMRSKKRIEPKSELFRAGFQCVKLVDLNKKVVVGGENSSVHVFNQNEWARPSSKFSFCNDPQNRSKFSVYGIDMLPDNSTFLFACSDSRIRASTLWPYQLISETIVCEGKAVGSIHVNPNLDRSEFVVCGGNYINVLGYTEKDEDEFDTSSENHGESAKTTPSAVSTDESDYDGAKRRLSDDSKSVKKLKANTAD